ncbi:hypothetical protein, partial [Klebsiella pneumoniae]|uniref:hypothetical protein n=1 Tax=Klebsiella pneumoniae TaxID=573 RepID=UPI0019543BA2
MARTKFEGFADTATLLAEQMLAKRSPGTRTWWRSHYHRKCSCIGCSDQETDLLAIFETTAGGRFALHIEVKHPA